MDDFVSMAILARTAVCYGGLLGSEPKQYGRLGDVCAGCGAKLSSYNPLDVCSICVGVAAEGIMEPTNRTSFRLMKHKRRVRARSERAR